MAKQWLTQRWVALKTALDGLTVEQEAQVKQVCENEIAEWRARGTMKSASSFKGPMTDTRNFIKTFILNEHNSYVNPKTGEHEHIALKYMNYSKEEWIAISSMSVEKFNKRMENQLLLEHPDKIIELASSLLNSDDWHEITIGLAVLTGRRLVELVKTAKFYPHTRYSVDFAGHLKNKTLALKPYEVPTIIEASIIIAAMARLRTMKDCSIGDTDLISKTHSTELSDIATEHFGELVPARDGKSNLYTHLFRAVYPRLAIYYYCPVNVASLAYTSEILGHYWTNGEGDTQRDFHAGLRYSDYQIGDGNGNIDGRQGIRLGEDGVEVLTCFKKDEPAKPKIAPKKDHSITRMTQATKSRLDQLQTELNLKTQDETISTLIDEYHTSKQLQALAPSANIINILEDVSKLCGDEGAIAYLRNLIEAKQKMVVGMAKRHAGKDYSKMSLTDLKKTKTSEAQEERFKRAVHAIMIHNENVEEPELRRFISATAIVDLVGGRPPDAKKHITEHHDEINEHHESYGITVACNRSSVPITKRIQVPELPA